MTANVETVAAPGTRDAPAPVPADLADAAKAAVHRISTLTGYADSLTGPMTAQIIAEAFAPLLSARDARIMELESQVAALNGLLTEAAEYADKIFTDSKSLYTRAVSEKLAALLKRAPTAGAALLAELNAYRRLDDAQYGVGEALSKQPGNDAELAAANAELHDARTAVAALEAQQGERTDGKAGQTT
jgi:hypothetical protein